MNTYLCNTYVNLNALFQSALWNMFDAESRTMNVCEGFHSSMNRSVGQHHPDIFKVIEFCLRHEEYNERIIAQLNMGASQHVGAQNMNSWMQLYSLLRTSILAKEH